MHNLQILGNKNGNKRTANIRSVGYSDLYVLSKKDLWNTLKEYPDAKTKLIEMGRKMLRKDNLLDEELAKKQELMNMKDEEKLRIFEKRIDNMLEEVEKVNVFFDAAQKNIKRMLSKNEYKVKKWLTTKKKPEFYDL